MKKLLFSILLLLPSLSFSAQAVNEAPGRGLNEGKNMPGIILPYRGEAFNLQSKLGDVVFLHFWASWCDACDRSIDAMSDLSKRFDGQVNKPTWIGINLDESDAAYHAAIDNIDFNFVSLRDPLARISKKLRVPQLPYTLIIDRDGVVRAIYQGFSRRQVKEYEQQLHRWLDTP
ncbi:TlpA family protein disulfide reductase [Pelagibaculum spongiae]|uniref:Thioredoxin domain-containing protein n=1 Tax=Pelagibaculum spongiae TaxID=2080658 RepID=A0A2V1GRJ1_9GAMM|nr:TlpA disulfide reductase family protein [Pelagibaculum spongiae]PVZ62986.1 hypothetical protein DC094_21710 [Pelagibaculum spongiae]